MNLDLELNLIALLPEIVLTVAICGVIILDLFLPTWLRWAIMPAAFLGVLASAGAVLLVPDGATEVQGGMFVVDRFSITFKLVFCFAALIVFVMSSDYFKDEADNHPGEYYAMMMCSLLGMMSISSSRDLIAIFVSLELISIPAFVLAGIRKGDVRSNEAALKFFLFGVLSTTLMLFGMSLLYGITGSTNLAEISRSLQGQTGIAEIGILSIFFIIVGFGFKISVFPFQWWVPDTYEGAPVPVAAFLSVASKTAGFVGLFQIMFLGLLPLADLWRPLFALLGVVTMTFGNLVAIQQKNIVRLLAYSSIAQAGYIVLPLGVASAANPEANEAIIFAAAAYLMIYAFMENGAFAAAIGMGKRGGGYLITDYAGLFSRAPGLALAMTAFLLSLAGIPPFAGWWAKFVVFEALIGGGGLWLAVAMALNTVIALFYYLVVIKRMFVDVPTQQSEIKLPFKLGGAIAFTAVAVVVLGVFPDTIGRLAQQLNFF
ncbi:MAG: NADH-quinone oxidoreductase subunit N [Actinomycetota bacterium]